MFKLKATQIASFAEAAARSLPERLLDFVRREVPEACGGDDAERVRQAMERAHGWELHGERDVATFVVLAFAHGMEFDAEPWAREWLARPDVPADARVHRTYEAAVRRALVTGTALAGKEDP